MRVALLQTRLDPKSRAANTQAINATIDRAAAAGPAPDLLVLPGACDAGGTGAARSVNSTRLEVIKENLAQKAREWGVFIAAGLHGRHEEKWVPCAVLFDPDGDVVARSAAPATGGEAESGARIELWTSAIGDLGVFEPTIGGPRREQVVVNEWGAVIAVPLVASLSGRRKDAAVGSVAALYSDPAASCGAYWAVVTAADEPRSSKGGSERRTFLRAPNGTIIACTDNDKETIVVAEVPIRPAACTSQTNALRHDGHAD